MLALLDALDPELFESCACWFAGGTAISIRCGEPRISCDVGFLCADAEGYRRLRGHLFGRDATALFRRPIEAMRELRVDRYGVRTALRIDGQILKLEIVSEGRIPLEPESDPELPLRRLCDVDLVAEKLLACADRGLDDAFLARDAIDLLLLEDALGGLPERAFEKARAAYGDTIDRAFDQVRRRLREDEAFRLRCFAGLGLAEPARALVTSRA